MLIVLGCFQLARSIGDLPVLIEYGVTGLPATYV